MGTLLGCLIVLLAFAEGLVVGFGVSGWRALGDMEALTARFERHQRELLRETEELVTSRRDDHSSAGSDAAADGWADAWKDAAAEVRRHRRRGE